jgi:plastocyanin
MRGIRFGLVVGFAAAALVVAGCGSDDNEAVATDTSEVTTLPATLPETGVVLKGTVGPGFDITLTTEDGQPVEKLSPGSYTLLTDDKADIHNFHLTGEGVEVDTGVSESGTNSFDVDLTSGTYTFVCDPHSSSMNGSFEVS